MTGVPTGSLRRMAVASAAAIPRVGVVFALLLTLFGCAAAPPASRPATSSVVTTSIASPTTTSAPATKTAEATLDGLVPIQPKGSDSDLVRDDLPGYTARPLQAETYVLRRSYVPADKFRCDALMIVAHRYADSHAAASAIASRTSAAAVTVREKTQAAGLAGYSFFEEGETVLVLQDGSLTLELRMHPGPRRSDLRKALVDVAETLLD